MSFWIAEFSLATLHWSFIFWKHLAGIVSFLADWLAVFNKGNKALLTIQVLGLEEYLRAMP